MPAAALGRPKGSGDKVWREAIRRAVMTIDKEEKTKKLELLARRLVSEGMGGDVGALKEIGDRLDGRSSQALTGEDGGPIEVVARMAWLKSKSSAT